MTRRLRAAGAVLAGICLLWAGAEAGLWWTPLALGVVTGVLLRLPAVARDGRRLGWHLAAGPIAAASWALPLLMRSMAGEPVMATARTVAGLAGAPVAALAIAATLLVPAVQAAVGIWTGDALAGFVAGSRTENKEEAGKAEASI